MMIEPAEPRRTHIWAERIGGTVVFAAALGLWTASLFWEDRSRLGLGDVVLVRVGFLGLTALACGIGVRLAEWWWVAGVFVATTLHVMIASYVVDWEPLESALEQIDLRTVLVFYAYLLWMAAAAAAGVWWGQRRMVTGG